MSRSPNNNTSMEVARFLQTTAHQLDLAQDALRLKVKTGRPLTWALRDLDIDLKVFIEIDRTGTMRWRTAAPNEEGASTVKLSFTSITREMVEENTFAWEMDEDPRSLEALQGDLSVEAREQLSLAGVRTVGQYKRLTRDNPRAVHAQTGIPVLDLQAALRRAARPAIMGHELAEGPDGEALVRIQGANLSDGTMPEVRLGGDPVEVLVATPTELLVRPLAHHVEGPVEVESVEGVAKGWFRLPGRSAVKPTVAPLGVQTDEDPWDGVSAQWNQKSGIDP